LFENGKCLVFSQSRLANASSNSQFFCLILGGLDICNEAAARDFDKDSLRVADNGSKIGHSVGAPSNKFSQLFSAQLTD